MSDENIGIQDGAAQRAAKPLFILRLTLGLFLLQWGIEKIIQPETSMMINDKFYGGIIPLDHTLSYILGGLESLLALAIIAGFKKRWSYLAGFIVHFAATASTWRHLINPYAADTNHLFTTAVPVLAAFWLIWQLRDYDTFLAFDDRPK